MNELNKLPLGERVYMAKYLALNYPNEPNIFKENMLENGRKDLLQKYDKTGRSKSLLKFQKLRKAPISHDSSLTFEGPHFIVDEEAE